MVKVIFYNLLRSKYNIKEEMVNAGSISHMINQILKNHPNMDISDFNNCVVFYKGKPIDAYGFETIVDDEENIIITHFVGGG